MTQRKSRQTEMLWSMPYISSRGRRREMRRRRCHAPSAHPPSFSAHSGVRRLNDSMQWRGRHDGGADFWQAWRKTLQFLPKISGRRVCFLDIFRRWVVLEGYLYSAGVTNGPPFYFTWLSRSALIWIAKRADPLITLPVVYVLEKLGENVNQFLSQEVAKPQSLASETAGPCREDCGFPSPPFVSQARFPVTL